MDPVITFVLAALVGAGAAWYAVYNQNLIVGVVLFAVGAAIVLWMSGTVASPGTGAIEDYFAATGVTGLVGAVLGGGIGGYLGDKQRKAEGKT